MLDHTTAYNHLQLRRAVNLGALMGWCIAVFPHYAQLGWIVLVFAIPFGLPVAFVSCWWLGAPILRRLMRDPVPWAKAALWGAGISAIIEITLVVLERLNGLYDYISGRSYQFGTRVVDGLLTPYGWWLQLQSSALWILYGALIGLILRAIIGPGRKPHPIPGT